MKKEYLIKHFSASEDIDPSLLEVGKIDEYAWGGDYMPEAYFKAACTDEGIFIYLRCREKEPRAECTWYMSPVYTDSCLEFFACYGEGGYINIECNSKGACLIAYGEGRANRVPLLDMVGMLPAVTPVREGELWGVDVFVPYELLKKVYKSFDPHSGYTFRGNAYKCGDKCEIPHYGTWNKILTEKPDFHRPEYFGKLIME